jgi:ubiquinone/menaquinone biosynthesis C-methylase UbiE
LNPEHPKPAIRPAPNASSPAREYSREVHSSWAEFLETLPRDARILDLDTGNHVVALIAADLAASGGYDWTIDAIDPQEQEQTVSSTGGQALIDRIEFHAGGTPSRLPFEDASFDAVGGHHVLEFTDSAVALAEVFRVLKPGGDAQFLMHHAESPLVQAAKVSLAEADLVFTQTKAFRRLHHLVTMSHIVPETTERASDEVRAAIRTLKQALPGAQTQGGGRVLSVALDSIQKLLSARRELKPDAAGLAVERAEADLRGSVRRLSELVARAHGEEQMQQVQQNAVAAGFAQIERMPQLHANTQVMAWQLLMHRP